MNPSGRYNQIDLRHRAGGFALEFEAEWDASVAALFGPSGAGKSTVLEIIAGARRDVTGRVVLDGRTILDTDRGVVPRPGMRWIGWVPQDASLFPHLSVGENLRYGLRRGGAEGERRLAAAVEVLELGSLLARPASALSGGERQRAAVARAIASGARVLLLDEPLGSLDVPLRTRVFPLFVRLRDEIKLPMLYVSHDAEEALALAPHVLVIQGGRCVASGRTADLLGDATPGGMFQPPETENRLRVRLLEARPEEGTAAVRLSSGLGLVMAATPPPTRDEFEVVVRGEEIIVALAPPGPLSAQNVIPGRVSSIEERRGHVWVTVEAPWGCAEGDRSAGAAWTAGPAGGTGSSEAAGADRIPSTGPEATKPGMGRDETTPGTGMEHANPASLEKTRFVARITRHALASLRLGDGDFVHLIFKANAVRAVTRTDRP